jgi:isoquinoline 1-oxidoreductase beta subunit
VQVVWSRRDDIRHDFYRQPTRHWLQAGWDDPAAGLTSWRHLVAAPGLNGIAYKIGRTVLLEGLQVPYGIRDSVSSATVSAIPLPTGPWRAVMAGTNAFANECFLDEVAGALGKDPYQLRRDLLGHNDPLGPVLELAVARAGWAAPLGPGRGRGVACHSYNETAAAAVAEVTVSAGAVRVDRIVVALDCGTVVNPDIVAQQMEGCVAFGLTSLFKDPITFQGGAVQQGNFDDYRLLTMGEMPTVEVHTVASTARPTGVGEMGVPVVVPAVVNAIAAATGKRIRRLPRLTPEPA